MSHRRSRSATAAVLLVLEKVTADGVGSKCAEAVEEAIAEPEALPDFPGDATVACRAESRQQ